MNYNDIIITTSANKIYVEAPYNASFVKRAKKLNGQWEPGLKKWSFNEKQEKFVREALQSIFGTDGTPCDMVTIELNYEYISQYCDYQTLWFGNIPLATRRGRDTSVQVKSGAYIISGNFTSSGGSLNYPVLNDPSESIKIRVEVPKKLFEEYKEDGVSLVETETETLEKLQSEKDDLMKRLDEIESQINKLNSEG